MQLALFDFDNTITTCDSYSRFLRRVATPEQLAQANWKVGPWLVGCRIGLVPARRLRERVTRLVFAGRDADDIAGHAGAYAHDTLPGLLRNDVMQRIEWHRARGHHIVVVSASLDLYLSPWCERLGLGSICNRLEANDGRLTGRYLCRDIGPYKVQEIRARYDLSLYERIHAYGDSPEDKPMLALAHERWYAGKRIR